jgi:hypothetical protein
MIETWPKRLRSAAAIEYLSQVHGITPTDKTMRNWRWKGTGPRWQYIGNIPYVEPAELDRWVAATLSDRPANGRKHARDEHARTAGDDQPIAA